MAAKKKLTYRDAGVDIDANDIMVERIKGHVRRTYGPRMMGAYGGFAGMFRLDTNTKLFPSNYREPVLVGCCDGVGTKILIAIAARRLTTVGIDLVAMHVNAMLTCGAEPLFFLDYIALPKLEPALVEQLVSGVADGCCDANCSLLGGETAEMPDLYRPNDFDLAGFAVGVVERKKIIGQVKPEPGDVVIGLPSSGVHSNGYSLVRKLVNRAKLKPDKYIDELGETVADALLRPTRIYVRPILALLRQYKNKPPVRGMAHITGSGLPGNIPRVLPENCSAVLNKKSWPRPKVYGWLEKLGADPADMWNTFNMGIGYTLMVPPNAAKKVIKHLNEAGQEAYPIGTVKRGKGIVEFR